MIGLIISFGAGVFFGAFIMSACVLAGRKDKDKDLERCKTQEIKSK